MTSVLLRAFSFTLVIVIGIVMRSSGLVSSNAGDAVKKFLIYITLPAAIITNFSAITDIGAEMVLIALLGIIANVIMIAAGALITRHRTRGEQALNMLCLPAFNIGAFCLPFVQSFLPALGSVTACMFDVGNSIMCTGGTYAFVAEYTSENRRGLNLKSFAKRLISSPPLVTYVVMFTLSVMGLQLPDAVLTLVNPMASANTFIAMLMLGLLFHLELKKEYIKEIIRLLGLRHIFAAVCALIFYFFLPFDLVIRQTLALLCFAPMSAVSPAYIGMCGGDEGLASCANSISILFSLVIITILLGIMGLN
ncbi:AEC family transporter [Murimonas intestini]|uniref:AEC family transporter n=1 Tax=Murimonas intestini TaxID=1337051 RepID=A0AB73T1C0_9FIRM|nr:hypothetical protein [Murimonas intestini]MCR1842437.1 hypothetical protein [Murimonas intestini]MCR1867205.1 hypothetical protein [Murimonas intestini]MCR1884391.1 hypothetical protein [Murimonas intestini]